MKDEADTIREAIAGLEAQRQLLGDAVVESALGALQQKLDAIRIGRSGPAVGEGERKLVTVMFADISGFTALSELRDPEEVRNIVNDCFEVLVPIVQRYGGTIDKFMGDAIMALFGAPVAHENDPERALLAALEMMEAFQLFSARSGLGLGLHFGINTGQVVTGNVGASGRGDFSVMGDAVNLAARLEDLSEIGEILVGPETHVLAGTRFDFEERPPVRVKGKQAAIPIFRLLGRNEDRFDRLRISAPLIGRLRERAVLQDAIRAVGQGSGGAIKLVGEAGLGKSRLLAEARREAQGVRWIEVRSQSHDQGNGFGAVRKLLAQLLGCGPDDQPGAVRGRLRDLTLRHGADETAYAQLATILGLGADDGAPLPIEAGPAEILQARFAATLALLLGRLAADEPLAIVWEDVHWADDSSLALLRQLMAGPQDGALLQIATLRPEAHVLAALADDRIACLELEPLEPVESSTLLRELLPVGGLDREIIELILGRAEGNPFFLEELIQSLIDSGAIVVSDGRAMAGTTLDRTALPPTLRGVMMARLDRLTAAEKQVLQTAAIIGRMFDSALLERMIEPQLKPQLPAVLRKLRNWDLVRPAQEADGGAAPCKFKHGVTQEVAYQSMLLSRRRQLHARAAEAYLELHGEEGAAAAAALAHHYENGGRPRQAARYLLRCAEAARSAYASKEALAFYRRIVGLRTALLQAPADGLQRLAAAYEGMGDLLALGGQHGEALRAFRSALGLVAAEDMVRRAGLLRRCGLTLMTRRDADRALLHYNQAGDALGAPPAGDSPEWWNEWIELQLDRMWALSWCGRHREMRDLVVAAAPEVEPRGHLGQRARFLDRQLILRMFKEDARVSDETVGLARTALAMATEWRELKGITMARFTLGFGLLWSDRIDEAKDEIAESLRLARLTGDAEYEVAALAFLTVAHRCAGDVDAAESLYLQSLESARSADMDTYVGIALANQSWVACRRGDRLECERLARKAAGIWDKQPWRIRWLAHWPLLRIAIEREDWDGAGRHARTILGREQYRMPEGIAEALGEALQAQDGGFAERAVPAFVRALSLAETRSMA
jgi:class 3 adenylate cyclase/tetratricopeptide (TPR) repeat protein